LMNCCRRVTQQMAGAEWRSKIAKMRCPQRIFNAFRCQCGSII